MRPPKIRRLGTGLILSEFSVPLLPITLTLLEVCSRKISRGITMSQYLALVPAPPQKYMSDARSEAAEIRGLRLLHLGAGRQTGKTGRSTIRLRKRSSSSRRPYGMSPSGIRGSDQWPVRTDLGK